MFFSHKTAHQMLNNKMLNLLLYVCISTVLFVN